MGTVPTRFENPMNSTVTNMACRSLNAESLCGLSPFLYRESVEKKCFGCVAWLNYQDFSSVGIKVPVVELVCPDTHFYAFP
jgi:hypothetical protein